MTKPDVIIPWNGKADRKQAYEMTKKYWETLGYNVITGYSRNKIWSKGLACDKGVKKSHSRVIIICDADIVCQPELVEKAVSMIEQKKAALVIPFTRLHNLDQDFRVVRTRQFRGRAGGCCVMLRSTYDAVGGIDPRFIDWGGEDWALCWAVETLVGRVCTLEGEAWHYYHPEPAGKHWVGKPPNYELYHKYMIARTSKRKMQELVEER